MLLTLIIILLLIPYTLLIFYYWKAWLAIPEFTTNSKTPQTGISVIIAARNEEEAIGALLTALDQQTYPSHLTEIIVIDDHSEDNTAHIVSQYKNVTLRRLQDDKINSYKKKAIETGIATATKELIVTTDADCIPGKDWLSTIAAFKEEKQAVFIAAPVSIDCSSSLVQMFQSLDFMVLQGITGAVVYKKKLSMCNGANLAYEKNVFLAVNGFSGIDHIASGDDMLLMHKIDQKYPDRVHYLKSKETIVSTQPVKTRKDFFSQRIRWASKARQYQDKRIFPVLLLVYLFNLSFLALLVAGFWDHRQWVSFLFFWIIKTVIEFPFFRSLSDFFDKQWANKWFFFFQPLHIFYIIIAGLFGQFGKYEWKGRQVR